jgi:hypothetical protein
MLGFSLTNDSFNNYIIMISQPWAAPGPLIIYGDSERSRLVIGNYIFFLFCPSIFVSVSVDSLL